MSDGYPLEIDGDEFQPIPESWLEHPDAYDAEAPDNALRMFAVSAAEGTTGRGMLIRYANPRIGVLRLYSLAATVDGGLVPAGLVEGGRWRRSVVPFEGEEPQDEIRDAEREHFDELWGDRVEDEQRVAVADGGLREDSRPKSERRPSWYRAGGEGLPISDDYDADEFWLFTCCNCGRRWVDPPGPPRRCSCESTDIVCHRFDPQTYWNIKRYGDPKGGDQQEGER